MICGIDPGKTGAIAFLYNSGDKDFFAEVHDMPMYGKEVNAWALAELFREFPPFHTYIESQNSFKMGRQTAFMYGGGYFAIQAILATLKLPYSKVSPAKWKKHFNLKGGDKAASCRKAAQLFPNNADDFKNQKDHGRAEALLIAKWGEDGV